MDRLRNAFELPQAYVPHRRVAAGPHQRAHRIGHEVSSGFGLLGEARGEDHRRADVRPVVLHRFANAKHTSLSVLNIGDVLKSPWTPKVIHAKQWC